MIFRQLMNEVEQPSGVNGTRVEGAAWDKLLPAFGLFIHNNIHVMFDTEEVVQTIKKLLLEKRAGFRWIIFTTRKRIQKRCSVFTQELMEVVWHPQRIQRFGWDIETM
jgi:hypothetical protein